MLCYIRSWVFGLHVIGPTHHWTDTPLVRHTIGPTHHWSDTPLVRHTIGPTHHRSDNPWYAYKLELSHKKTSVELHENMCWATRNLSWVTRTLVELQKNMCWVIRNLSWVTRKLQSSYKKTYKGTWVVNKFEFEKFALSDKKTRVELPENLSWVQKKWVEIQEIWVE